jgi:acetyl esterase/lipase
VHKESLWHRRRRFLSAGSLALSTLGLTACSASRAFNALSPTDTYTLLTDLPYGGDPRQRLDMYLPVSPPPPGGHPVALFFYGGSWNRGERGDYRFIGEALASRGVLTVIADYRLYPQVRYPDFLHDCAAALAWTLREAASHGGNVQRTFVMGHSAGAYNAAMLALDARWLEPHRLAPSVLAGWIGLAGPYDFIPIVNPEVRPVFHHPDVPPDSQPIRHADQLAVRSFLAAPTADSLVNPQRNTARLAERLQGAGTDVSLHWYERTNHVTLAAAFSKPLRWLSPVLDDVERFVKKSA